jgi:hypothetical protein
VKEVVRKRLGKTVASLFLLFINGCGFTVLKPKRLITVKMVSQY